ncbi:hypothetical protein V6238_03865 [Marinomonas arenicola]
MIIRRSTDFTAYMHNENFVSNCQIPVVPPSMLTYDVTRKPSTA